VRRDLTHNGDVAPQNTHLSFIPHIALRYGITVVAGIILTHIT